MPSPSSLRVTSPWTPCVSGRGRTAESWTRTPSRSAWLQRDCWRRRSQGEVKLLHRHSSLASVFLLNIIFKHCLPPPHTHTYLCLTQCLLLRPQPSLSMPCRTASCLMLRTQSRCCPLEGAVSPAKTGPGTAGTQKWTQHLEAPNGGRAMAQHGATEPEEQRLLSCMG